MLCNSMLEPAEVWKETLRRAAKTHKCHACGSEIDSGNQYVEIRCVYDGTAETMRVHSDCHEIGMKIRSLCNVWSPATLAEDVSEHIRDIGTACLPKTLKDRVTALVGVNP